MSAADLLTGLVCLALTGMGLVTAARSARTGRLLRATRWTAAALVPFGLYLTGLATLARRVGTALADFAGDFVFGVKAWAGVAMLAIAVLLFMATRMASRRRTGTDDSTQATSRGTGPLEVGGTTSARSVTPPTAPKAAVTGRRRSRGGSPAGDEFGEIEEILRRRGI